MSDTIGTLSICQQHEDYVHVPLDGFTADAVLAQLASNQNVRFTDERSVMHYFPADQVTGAAWYPPGTYGTKSLVPVEEPRKKHVKLWGQS